ncbi:MAG: monovalent cation/H+ antiporter complex subunit F [Emergencia sp.]
MEILFKVLLFLMVLVIGLMLIRVFIGPSVYDRLNGIFVIGIDVIVVILLVGFIDGRIDMYVDIAISYGILGFLSTVIIAKFLVGRIGGKEEEE